MIEVLECKTSSEKYPDTFGYMSLGSMELGGNILCYYSFLTIKCLYLNKEFELILLSSFFTSGELLVLGNLDNLPGDFIADREEFMRELKSILESEKYHILEKNSLIYNQYDQDMKFNIDNYGKNSLYNQYNHIDNYGKNTSISCY